VAVVWGRRQYLLQASESTLSADWLSYLRLLNRITLGIWLGWLGLGWLGFGLWAEPFLDPMVGMQPSLLREGLAVSLFVLPPVGVIAGCYALSYRLFVRVGSTIWTKADLVQQVVWGQLRSFLPLTLFFSGCRLFFSNQPTLAMMFFGVAYLSQLLLTQLASQAHDLSSQALTTGELRDRIFSLAAAAAINLQQIYIMPSKRGRMANAFALQGGNVILTEPLLHHLSRREIDAVMAHELAHLQYQHPQRLQVILLTVGMGTLISHLLLSIWLPGLPVIPIGLLVLLLVYYSCSRQFEYAADRQAARLSDPTAMITGLVKLAHLTGTPLDWGRRGWMMTHPSMRQRIEAIGRFYGIAITAQLLDRSRAATESPETAYYNLPPIGSPIFSSQFKQQSQQRLLWSWMGALLLPPLLLVSCSHSQTVWTLSQIGWHILAGCTSIVLSQIVVNRMPLWGYARLRRQLSQKLAQQGFDFTACNAIFVGLAPDATQRCYEGFAEWDLGFLWVQGDQLCYVGEQTRFALNAAQMQVTLEARHWRQTTSLVIRWQSGSESGLLKFHVCEARSLSQMQVATRRLKQQIEQWQQTLGLASAVATSYIPIGIDTTDTFAALSAPQIGCVTSQSRREHQTAQISDALIKLAAILLGLSLIWQIPWNWQPGSSLYLVFVAMAGLIWRFGMRFGLYRLAAKNLY
jgi:heat shock protein HtpX